MTKPNTPWDGVPAGDLDPQSSIDHETLDWYQEQFYRSNPGQRQIKDPLEFLLEWNYMVHQNGAPALTRAAVMLFGVDRCVRAMLPRAVLDYQRIDTRFELWLPDERWDDRTVFEENLFKTWRGMVAKYWRIAEHPFRLDTDTLRRNDDPPDYVAFREAVINLLIHQDYGDLRRKSSIKWFADQIQLWNPGDALSSTAQLLESNVREVRNPLIVNAFRRIGLSDQAGTGIRAIFRNWNELGRVLPKIQNDKTDKSFGLVLRHEKLLTEAMLDLARQLDVRLTQAQTAILAQAVKNGTVRLPEAAMVAGINREQARAVLEFLAGSHLLELAGQGNYRPVEAVRALAERQASTIGERRVRYVSGGGQEAGRVQDGTEMGFSQEQALVLGNCLKEKGILELMALLGRTNRTKFRDQVLKPLIAGGWVEMTLPEKPTSGKQRYRLTGRGRAWVGAE